MKLLPAAALAAAMLAPPAVSQEPPAADPACSPAVASALEDAAASGVEAEFLVIRNPETGIRDPMSILEFSCIGRMFDYGIYNIFFDPGRAMSELLGVLNRQVCSIARDAYRDAIGRPYTPDFIRDIRRLPGVSVPRDRLNILRDIGIDEDLNRTIIQGG